MHTPFNQITRVALEEMVGKHLTPSKFGSFLSREAREALIDDLLAFLETSRSLQAAGDKLLQNPDPQNPKSSRK